MSEMVEKECRRSTLFNYAHNTGFYIIRILFTLSLSFSH